MAKRALLDVLEQTIGKYVLNLDAESLNVAVWSGKIELHKLDLNVDAVNRELQRKAAEAPNLALPIRVLEGSFESFQVDVPWSKLLSQAVVLRAKGLSVVVEPYDRLAEADYLQSFCENETLRAKKTMNARKESLAAAEDYRQHTQSMAALAEAQSTQNGKQQDHSSSFSSRLVRRIIENLSISIEDVHVVVKDEHEGSAGVVLESLRLDTTDEQGRQRFVDRTHASAVATENFLYKMLQINGLGLYVDSNENQMNAITEDDDDLDSIGPLHTYVVAPLTFSAKLRQADRTDPCVDHPKYKLQSELPGISLVLSRLQLDWARSVMKKVSKRPGTVPLFPEYRPLQRVHDSRTARQWWKYAVRCIGRLNGRRSWTEFVEAFRKRKRYLELYKRKAHHSTCPWMKPLTKAESEEVETIEADRSLTVDSVVGWRNIADAQMRKEREKHDAKKSKKGEKEEKGLFSYVFGKKTDVGSVSTDSDSEANEPPIHLSPDELKDLERMSKQDFMDDDLSSDSNLCSVGFVLGAIKLNLIAYDSRTLAALQMGEVSLGFDARMDGAYSFDFAMAALGIEDMITPNTLFRKILKNTNENEAGGVFEVHLARTKAGDQDVGVSLAPFTAVLSPNLVRELHRFVSATSVPTSGKSRRNPVLAQSVSGSIDLFYDADQGASVQGLGGDRGLETIDGEIGFRSGASGPSADDDWATMLIDAWKQKTENKTALRLNLDINAPTIVVPQESDGSSGSVVVFDLGVLRVTYGNAGDRATKWFRSTSTSNPVDLVVDGGCIRVDDLTLLVGQAAQWEALSRRGVSRIKFAVIQPISVVIDYGVESHIETTDVRFCSFCVVPSIDLMFSTSMGKSMRSVVSRWMALASELRDNGALERPISKPLVEAIPKQSHEHAPSPPKVIGSNEVSFYSEVVFQRTSINAVTPASEGLLEAHLVSSKVTLSSSKSLQSQFRIQMGWFWVVDRMNVPFVRHQRLLLHSRLPSAPNEYAQSGDFDIMKRLESVGAFDEESTGSSELADIMVTTLPSQEDADATVDVEASFTSFALHWNPYAFDSLLKVFQEFSSLVEESEDTGNLIVPSSTEVNPTNLEPTKGSEPRTLRIRANLGSLDCYMNSALDDNPFFVLTVAMANVDFVTGRDGAGSFMQVSLGLGDVRLSTPSSFGSTLGKYRTLVGLSPGQDTNILSVKYTTGKNALAESCGKDALGLESFAEIDLSPMRIVYIQSQIMAFVEYTTEGVLGVLTSQAAVSAAEAAADLANAASKKLFRIRATALDLLLPVSACSEDAFSIRTGEAAISFEMLGPGQGSTANIRLSGVCLKDYTMLQMQKEEIQMSVSVRIPDPTVGSMDDQALNLALFLSESAFLISKPQYEQILLMLDRNFSSQQLFLRDEEPGEVVNVESGTQSSVDMTHSGIEAVYIERRMKVEFEIASIGIELFKEDFQNPLIQITAVDTRLFMKKCPDINRYELEIALKNLICRDVRRCSDQSTSLLRQEKGTEDSDGFFAVRYASENSASDISVLVGTPEIVVVPDAISETLDWVKHESSSEGLDQAERRSTSQAEVNPERQDTVFFTDASGNVEAGLSGSVDMSITKIHISTGLCRVVFQDLGSIDVDELKLSEVIAIQGILSTSLSMASRSDTSELVEATFEVHGDSVEAYSAFGVQLSSPLQILDPANFSVHASIKTDETGTKLADVRGAALTPVDLVLSMQTAALALSISSSLMDSLSSPVLLEDDQDEVIESFDEATLKRISNINSAMTRASSGGEDTLSRATSIDVKSRALQHSSSSLGSSSFSAQLKLTMAETKISFVNDLQGLDEALFRVIVRNFVTSGHFKQRDEVEFDVSLNTALLADYFDSTLNIWTDLLNEPWEITLKSGRQKGGSATYDRFNTTFDLESLPCSIALSDKFLVSLAGASRMWSIYSAATASAQSAMVLQSSVLRQSSRRRSIVANASRNLITSLPYAIDNSTDMDIEFVLPGGQEDKRSVASGTVCYFRFDPPRSLGHGGKRLYGQDVMAEKKVELSILGQVIEIGHLDILVGCPRCAHDLGDGNVLLSGVQKDGKTIILSIQSSVVFVNMTRLPMAAGVRESALTACPSVIDRAASTSQESFKLGSDGTARKKSKSICAPVGNVASISQQVKAGSVVLPVVVAPEIGGGLLGHATIELSVEDLKSESGEKHFRTDVTCRAVKSSNGSTVDPFVVQALVRCTLLDNFHVAFDVALKPRATVENKIPLPILLRSPMPHLYTSTSRKPIDSIQKESDYALETNEELEIFTPGPSIAVVAKLASTPVGGAPSGWMEGGWIDLPLMKGAISFPEPLHCIFPFDDTDLNSTSTEVRGSLFFIAEGSSMLRTLANIGGDEPPTSESVEVGMSAEADDDLKRFFFTVAYYAVDHTGDLLFEESREHRRNSLMSSGHMRRLSRQSIVQIRPFGAFGCENRGQRITLLPGASVPIRLLKMSMDREDGIVRSMPFTLDEIPIGDGGVDSAPIAWENKKASGYYSYRTLLNDHQSEIHFVPEYVVFNGSKSDIVIEEKDAFEMRLLAGQSKPMPVRPRSSGLHVSFHFVNEQGRTSVVQLGVKLGVEVRMVSSRNGAAIGSVPIQTAIDNQGNARLVIKVGKMSTKSDVLAMKTSTSMLSGDFLRFRVRWTSLSITLKESKSVSKTLEKQSSLQNAITQLRRAYSPRALAESRSPRSGDEMYDSLHQFQEPVSTIVFSRFTVDYQRIFKDDDAANRSGARQKSPERGQLSVIVHGFQIRDETPRSPFPIVLESSASASFFDLCIRVRGSLAADVVRVDLFDLNLSRQAKENHRIVLNTTEEFVWKLLDVVNQIGNASGGLHHGIIKLAFDEDHGGYKVVFEERKNTDAVQYVPPRVDTLYDISLARVSPFTVLLSFRRNPQRSRYKDFKNVRGANLMNYFTQRLKFTIDRAELKFSRYVDRSLRGPPDRLLEALATVYMSRMKFKLVTLLTAASVQDWRYLASRDGGDDEYVEGDLLRATGNLSGKTINYVLKKASTGIGDGISGFTNVIGNQIERGSASVGAGFVGSGVNNVLSGVGDGIGNTVTGVGSGFGKIFKGTGQGLGQVFGGISGGAVLMGKGIGKGLVTGDGMAVVDGMTKGASAVGSGVGRGLESTATGAADGLFVAGKGFYKGAKSVTQGVGGAITGKKKSDRRQSKKK